MASTRERDAFPNTLSLCTRPMFSSTEALASQWESSVFVSPIKAPALIILDEYRAEGRIRFSSLIALAGMVLTHRFSSSSSRLDHLYQERRFGKLPPPLDARFRQLTTCKDERA